LDLKKFLGVFLFSPNRNENMSSVEKKNRFKKLIKGLSLGLFIFIALIIIVALIVIPILLSTTTSWKSYYQWQLFAYTGTIFQVIGLFTIIIILLLLSFFALSQLVRYIHARKKSSDEENTFQWAKITKWGILLYLVGIGILIPIAPDLFASTDQYKKTNRDQITILANGHPESVLQFSNYYLEDLPNDLEAYYLKTLALGELSHFSESIATIKAAENLGLSFERFLAGPRNLCSKMYASTEFQAYNTTKNITLIHGPVIGNVSSGGVDVWVRTVGESAVQVIYSLSPSMNPNQFSQKFYSQKLQDYTATIPLTNLQPNTTYYIQLIVDNQIVTQNHSSHFQTYPSDGSAVNIKIGFGGGAGYTPKYEYMWNTIKDHELNSFLFLGDNVYIDTPEVPETQKYCYYRRQSQLSYRNFTATTPIYAIWDDHDFGDNDCTSTLAINDPIWKPDVLDIFKQNFPNPSYGNGNTNPGVWFNFSIGDVDIIMLDCRYYRQNPNKITNPSMLGPDQKAWLLKTLNESTATFKIIASSVPWASGTKPGSKDTWDGFPQEREEIFSFIETNKVEGMLFLSADRHRSDIWEIDRSTGYNFYDLMSSRLTNMHTHGEMSGAIYSYNKKCSFGQLSIDTSIADPSILYEVYSIDDEIIYQYQINKSNLQYP
jgi:alkaline phosphatase D